MWRLASEPRVSRSVGEEHVTSWTEDRKERRRDEMAVVTWEGRRFHVIKSAYVINLDLGAVAGR